MAFTEFIHTIIHDYTLRTISLGTSVMGISCGVLGSFAMLRKQSLLGDAISHAALPGIAMAFLITGIKNPFVLFTGAIISGIIGTFWIMGIVNRTHLKADTALGIVLSVFFGFGMLLLTIIQKQPNANQAGLEKYLFGQAATLLLKDVNFMIVTGSISLLILLIFWKEFKILAFDPQFLQTLGFRIKLLDIVLTILIVISIVIGLQTVGVVLMSAMLLAPAAAARQWTNRLGVMVLLASLFGAFSGITGTAISASTVNLATGPVIVLVAISLVLISFIFAPNRGILFKQVQYYKSRKNLRINKTLLLMYDIARGHEDYSHPHAINILNNFKGFSNKSLRQMESEGLIKINNNNWVLTPKGYSQSRNLFVKK